MQKVMEEEEARGKAFDWWFLIKLLIIFGILFLLLLIALSNLKRR